MNLTRAIDPVPESQKIVLFMNELSWMATKNSRLPQNRDYYWNQHCWDDERSKLNVCGSSALWIIDKIINNKGALHHREWRRNPRRLVHAINTPIIP